MKKRFASLLILFSVGIVYAPSVQNGFVWDDTALVLRDPLIRSWRLIPESFNHFLFTDATASNFYRPIQRLSYTLDYAVFGFRTAAYHLTSILWHAAAAIALLFFAAEFLRLFGVAERARNWLAFAAAGIWAIHPVHNAAVVYISGRADPLAALFGFCGLYLGLRALRAGARASYIFLFGSGICFLLSVFSRESGFLLIAIWLVLLALLGQWRGLIKAGITMLFISAVYFSLRLSADHTPPPQLRAPPPLHVKPLIAARAVAEYAGLAVFPLHLHVDRDVETRPSGFAEESLRTAAWREMQTMVGILLIAAAIYLVWRVRRRNPAVFACLVAAIISYLPVSGLFQLNATVAEHWIYLPTAFLALALAMSCADFVSRTRDRVVLQRLSIVLIGAWVVFLSIRTYIRTYDWKDQRTFFTRTIASGGQSVRMLINLGGLEVGEGNLAAAAEHLHRALDKEPRQPLAILNLAAVALKQNDFKFARTLLGRAVEMPLVAAQAHEMLAVLENKETKTVDLRRMRLATNTGASNWSIEKRYIKVLDETGQTEAAIREVQKCLQTQWYRAESWQLLGELLTKTGRSNEAARAFKIAHDYDVRLSERNSRG